MTTLNSIMNTATQALYAAQTGLAVTSDNIANVNTTGYVRKVLDQTSTALIGVGQSVSVSGVSRAANQYLQNAALTAAGDAGSAGVVSDLISQAQALFGDPSSSTSYLNQLNQIYSDFSAAANDPASGINSIQAVNDVSQFLTQSKSIAGNLSQLTTQADSRVRNDIDQVNQLLNQIAALNVTITATTSAGTDAADAQNAQSTLINQLSSLVDVQSTPTANGGVVLRAASGATLVGAAGPATLSYQSSASEPSQVLIAQPGGGPVPTSLSVASGEINGLLSLRNNLLPAVSVQLSNYVTGAVSAINQAANAASSVPPPTTLTGRNTGVDQTTALSGFTGVTNVAIVSPSGLLQQQITIDFGAGTMTDGVGTVTNFTPATFDTSLTTALAGAGTASFTKGVLSITGAGGNGVAIADDPTAPSSKVGQGFSQYLGLNDLISTNSIINYHSGITAADPNGFTPGGSISLQLTGPGGSQIAAATVSIPALPTMQDVVNALNSNTSGLGLYGQFSLDSAGALAFKPVTPGASLSVVNDNTQWGSGGASLSQLYGIGANQMASRTNSFSVRSDIVANPSGLQTATLDLSATPNPVLAIGDGTGAAKLAKAGQTTTFFDAAGGLAAMTTTATQYAAQLGGALGNQAAAASTASSAATAVQAEAKTRQQSVEGVNMDQELVNLTTFQQAYSAASRLVTANQDMFSALMNMIR